MQTQREMPVSCDEEPDRFKGRFFHALVEPWKCFWVLSNIFSVDPQSLNRSIGGSRPGVAVTQQVSYLTSLSSYPGHEGTRRPALGPPPGGGTSLAGTARETRTDTSHKTHDPAHNSDGGRHSPRTQPTCVRRTQGSAGGAVGRSVPSRERRGRSLRPGPD